MLVFRLAVAAAAFAALYGSGCSPAPTYAVRTYRMGERVQLGDLVYHVYESQWRTHLGEGAGARVPRTRFLMVRVSVANAGHSAAVVPPMAVTDETGRQTAELSDGAHVPQWIGYLRQVKPGDTLQGNVAFDCPPRSHKLRLADPSEERTALVEIPLSFSPDTPEMPAPGAARTQ